MSLALVLLGYVSYIKSKIVVKSDYSLDTLQEKDLLKMAFARYWQTEELLVPAAQEAADAGAPDSDFYETVAAFYYSQADDNKYGVYGAEYLLALNKLLESHVNDGKYLLGRADYYKKREDYDAARDDYRQLMDIYPDDLWIPYAIAFTYRKQEMKEEAKAYLKYINKNLPRIQVRLQNQAGSGEAGDTVKSVIDSNDQVGRMAKVLLKSKKPASNV